MLGKPVRLGLAAKIFLGSTLLVVTVLGASLGITALSATRTADASIERALTGTRQAITNLLATRTRTLAAMSAVSAGVPQFREGLIAGRERADILHRAQEYRDLVGTAWVLVTNESGILLARTDYPDQVDRDLSSGALVAGALSGAQGSGAWLDDVTGRLDVAGALAGGGVGVGVAFVAPPPRRRLVAFFLQQSHRRRVVASDHLARRHRIEHAVHARGSHHGGRVRSRHLGLVGHGAVLAARRGGESERYKPANHGYPRSSPEPPGGRSGDGIGTR